jgi:hypothetical protein
MIIYYCVVLAWDTLWMVTQFKNIFAYETMPMPEEICEALVPNTGELNFRFNFWKQPNTLIFVTILRPPI